MKRFYLKRNQDISGVSGTGNIAEGVQFDDGYCALVWLSDKRAMTFYESVETIESIHGHQGATKIVWIDGESSNYIVSK